MIPESGFLYEAMCVWCDVQVSLFIISICWETKIKIFPTFWALFICKQVLEDESWYLQCKGKLKHMFYLHPSFPMLLSWDDIAVSVAVVPNSCWSSDWFTTVTAERLRWHHHANCLMADRRVEYGSVCEQCDWLRMRQGGCWIQRTNGHIRHSLYQLLCHWKSSCNTVFQSFSPIVLVFIA